MFWGCVSEVNVSKELSFRIPEGDVRNHLVHPLAHTLPLLVFVHQPKYSISFGVNRIPDNGLQDNGGTIRMWFQLYSTGGFMSRSSGETQGARKNPR